MTLTPDRPVLPSWPRFLGALAAGVLIAALVIPAAVAHAQPTHHATSTPRGIR